jgi:hypothetical protein
MLRNLLCAMALAMAMAPAQAQDAEVMKMREELRQLQQRMQVLERKLNENAAQAAQAAQASNRPSAPNALNPGISAILNGVYANLSRDPERYRIGGFVPSTGDVSPGKRGLSLGESELGLSANVDHLFRGSLVAAISPDDNGVEIEEGYIQSTGLSQGFTVKAGRFFSSVGYQNEIHAHAWDFVDAPLVMKAFLGGQLADDGIQLRWVAPTELYFDAGLELGRGRAFPAGPGGGRNKNGFGSGNLFAHLGGDLNESTAWQAGVSYLATSPRNRGFEDVDSTGAAVTDGFSGTSRLWALGGVLKWSPQGNATERNLKLQGEYFRRREHGTLTYDVAAQSLGTMDGSYASTQSGWYVQGAYQFMPHWRAGYRYDRLDSGTTRLGLVDSGALGAVDFPILAAYNPRRQSAMVDWSPSEFSRLRLQFARDYSRPGKPDDELFLQYIVSLGAHGAHTF